MNGCQSGLYTHYITVTVHLKDAKNLVAKSDRYFKILILLHFSAAYEKLFNLCFLKNFLTLFSKTINILEFYMYSFSGPLFSTSSSVHYINITPMVYRIFFCPFYY